jgi:hypothetical protein
MDDYVDLIVRRIQHLRDIQAIIRDTPLMKDTLEVHCDLRRNYVNRLVSIRELLNSCLREIDHQEARINRHIMGLEAGKK